MTGLLGLSEALGFGGSLSIACCLDRSPEAPPAERGLWPGLASRSVALGDGGGALLMRPSIMVLVLLLSKSPVSPFATALRHPAQR